jgi:hypothetical protein
MDPRISELINAAKALLEAREDQMVTAQEWERLKGAVADAGANAAPEPGAVHVYTTAPHGAHHVERLPDEYGRPRAFANTAFVIREVHGRDGGCIAMTGEELAALAEWVQQQATSV